MITITIDLSTLFFVLLAAALVSAYYSQPGLTNLIAAFGHEDSATIFFWLSTAHWILGPGIIIYSAWDIHYTEILEMDNLWETMATCVYLCFLGHHYATLRTWVRRDKESNTALHGSLFPTKNEGW